jgi:hypothetical protein
MLPAKEAHSPFTVASNLKWVFRIEFDPVVAQRIIFKGKTHDWDFLGLV